MRRYAAGTAVSADRSEAEIKATLKRYGAAQYVSGWKDGQVLVGFQMAGKVLRFVMPMPLRTDEDVASYMHGRHRRQRSEGQIDAALDQAARQRWRALALVIKAKLEAVQTGVATFEHEFLAHVVVPGTGKTVAELVLPQVDESYRTGRMPEMLGWEKPR